jgi:phage terminase small subunit
MHLAAPTRAWWRGVVTAYDLDPHHLRLLTLAAEAWDRGQDARAALAQHGSLTFTDRYGCPHPRPEVAIERDARTSFARLLRELDLDGAPAPDARPPRLTRNGG